MVHGTDFYQVILYKSILTKHFVVISMNKTAIDSKRSKRKRFLYKTRKSKNFYDFQSIQKMTLKNKIIQFKRH